MMFLAHRTRRTTALCAAVAFVLPAFLGPRSVASDVAPAAAPSSTPVPVAASAATWPQWRGPSRDGRVAGPEWPADLQPDHLSRSWRVADLGPSYSGPIVTDDRVFTTETRDEKNEIVRAFDRATGKELWKTQWAGAMKVPFFAAKNGSWIRSTPAFDEGRLFVAGMQDVLVCLDAASGDIVWTVDFKTRYGTPGPEFGFVCSPLVVGDHVYVQAGASCVKLDKSSGATVWRALEGAGGMDSAFSSPVMATIGGRPQLVVQTREALCGVADDDGSTLWSERIRSFRGMNILTPYVLGDTVFTAPYGGQAQLIAIGGDAGPSTAAQVWSESVQGYMTSPVVIDGHAYFFTRSNRFVCIDVASGEKRWTSEATGDTYWSLVAQGDRILALSDAGELRLIRATPEKFDVIDRVTVADDQTWAHLAVAGRDLFVREQGGLTALRWE